MPISFVYNYLVETFTKIDLAKDLAASYLMNEVAQMGERMDITLCLLVQQTVVAYRTKAIVWLWCKMQGTGV